MKTLYRRVFAKLVEASYTYIYTCIHKVHIERSFAKTIYVGLCKAPRGFTKKTLYRKLHKATLMGL